MYVIGPTAYPGSLGISLCPSAIGDCTRMAGKPRRNGKLGRQFAALPIREEGDKALVLLVTSRETGRWLLPKGWVEKRLSGGELAAREATRKRA